MSKSKSKNAVSLKEDVQNRTSDDLKQVQDHYLDYPYPYRNPEDDKVRLIRIYGDCLGELNHWLYKGKENFQNKFRVLVAGGGTGDSAIFLAEQLKDTNAEVVYLDFSKTTMAIAQKRAEYRGLNNITWINDSILNIPNLKLGLFDYINCVGVLHHLPSPDDGLKILRNSLSPKGGMGLMVYAQYGRTGLYHIQTLMRMVNRDVSSRQEEVKNGWTVMKALPATNWFSRGGDLLGDHVHMGDPGLYDMFLHKQDRAYTVPELYDFVKKAGLNFVDFNSSHSRLVLRLENYIKDPVLLAELKKRDLVEQQAMCEIITGNIIKHSFFVSNQKDSVASFDELNNVPYFYTIPNLSKQIYDYLEANPHISMGGTVNFSWKSELAGDLNITLPVNKYTKYLFKYMVTEDLNFKEIFNGIRKDTAEQIEDKTLTELAKNTLSILHESGALLMRDKKVGPFKNFAS